jgi:ribosome-associated protein
MLDIRPLSVLTDYFVIASADSERQLKAILEEVLSKMGQAKSDPLSMEGTADSGWIILDYGGVIVHLFTPGQRGYYDLEGLWSDAPLVVRIQ